MPPAKPRPPLACGYGSSGPPHRTPSSRTPCPAGRPHCRQAAALMLLLAGALAAQPGRGRLLQLHAGGEGEQVSTSPPCPAARVARTRPPSSPSTVVLRASCSRGSPCRRTCVPHGRSAGYAVQAPQEGRPPAGLSTGDGHGERCARALSEARRALFTSSKGARGARCGWCVRAFRAVPACLVPPPDLSPSMCSRRRREVAVCVVYVSCRASVRLVRVIVRVWSYKSRYRVLVRRSQVNNCYPMLHLQQVGLAHNNMR